MMKITSLYFESRKAESENISLEGGVTGGSGGVDEGITISLNELYCKRFVFNGNETITTSTDALSDSLNKQSKDCSDK